MAGGLNVLDPRIALAASVCDPLIRRLWEDNQRVARESKLVTELIDDVYL